jgi:acetyltransferase-like isoleucine patch superfamily enzyme
MNQAAHIDPSAELAPDVAVGPGVSIGAGVRVAAGTEIGANAVIHAGTQIGANCLIEPLAVLGKRPRLRRGSSAAGRQLGALTLGDEVTVCSGAVLYAGAEIAGGVIVGDQAQVRELARIGERSVVGRASCVDFDARVGAHVLIQTGVYVTGGSLVEDHVFIGPGVTTTNDHTMGRYPHDEPLQGPTLRRACRVGGGAVLTPGIEIGEEAFVAAGAVVIGDVARRDVVVGVPARVLRQVLDSDLLEHWR